MEETKKKNLKKAIKIICIVLIIAIIGTGSGLGIKYYVDGLVPEDVHNAIQSQAVAKGEKEVRVMTANLLNVYGASNSKVSKSLRKSSARPRSKIFFEVLNTFKPDVVGLQEICNDWYDEIIKNEDGYEFLFPGETREQWHMTCMIYNKNTTKVLEKDNFKLKDSDAERYRRIEWGLFEDLNTGKKYVVTSTHLDFLGGANDDPKEKLKIMKKEADELTALVKDLTEKYKVPVYMTGDYNTVNNVENWRELWPEKTPEEIERDLVPQQDELMFNQAPEIYNYICESFTDTKLVAKSFDSKGSTTIDSPTYDHIFTNNDKGVSRYVIISDKSMLKLSDHYCAFVDVTL